MQWILEREREVSSPPPFKHSPRDLNLLILPTWKFCFLQHHHTRRFLTTNENLTFYMNHTYLEPCIDEHG